MSEIYILINVYASDDDEPYIYHAKRFSTMEEAQQAMKKSADYWLSEHLKW